MTKLPKVTLEFIKNAAPDAARTPLDELQERFAAKKEEERRQNSPLLGGQLPNPNTHGAEYMVELRIREWMMRQQREHDEQRRRAAEAQKNAAPLQGPPRNGNKITPPAP